MFPDGTKFYPDIQNGKRGYNTDPARGADTFFPFNSYLKSGTHILTSGTNKIKLDFQPNVITASTEVNNLSILYKDGTTYYAGVSYSETINFVTSVQDGFIFDEFRFNANQDVGLKMWYIALILQE